MASSSSLVAFRINHIGQRTDIKMRWLVLAAIFFVGASSAAAPTITQHLGSFSNQRTVGSTDDPHTEGYSLDLYREGKRIFGKLCVSTGIETPCGIIDNAQIIPSTSAIRFRAKLSTGTEFSRSSGPQGRPSRDLFEFAGTIGTRAVKGRLVHRSGYDAESAIQSQRIVLRRIHTTTSPVGYAEWSRDTTNVPADW